MKAVVVKAIYCIIKQSYSKSIASCYIITAALERVEILSVQESMCVRLWIIKLRLLNVTCGSYIKLSDFKLLNRFISSLIKGKTFSPLRQPGVGTGCAVMLCVCILGGFQGSSESSPSSLI